MSTEQEILDALDFETPTDLDLVVCSLRPNGLPCGHAARWSLICRVCGRELSMCTVHVMMAIRAAASVNAAVFCPACHSRTAGKIDDLFVVKVI